MPFKYRSALDSWARGTEAVNKEWQDEFMSFTENYNRNCGPVESAEVLRSLAKSGLLRYTDMRDAPERFFAAHRLLASRILGGFGIRFTVQFNLFAGSILGLGGPQQQKKLDELQQSGELGCFALTEVGAGVLSGFIVKTTATYNAESNGFYINTPDEDAEKNWISQGLVADWVVVFADLMMNGKSHGPHPFLLRMRDESGQLRQGIRVTDMGPKTVANDLDNARIGFDNVFIPSSCLLNRFCDIVNGQYTQIGNEPMRIEVIGQRLLTGRLAIAESALVAVRQLFLKSRQYAEQKLVNGISGKIPLASLPHLSELFHDANEQLTALEVFSASVEARLAEHLRNGTIPDPELVEAIAVCKVRNVDVATQMEHRLEQEVGSYALMKSSGFIYKDMLLCCKFAEGDSRILMQKMARDELKRAQKAGYVAMTMAVLETDPILRNKAVKTLSLATALATSNMNLAEAFTKEWKMVYDLAEAICDVHVHRRPKGEEIARVLNLHPNLMPALQEPLLVSRL